MRVAVLTHNYPRFAGDFSGVFVATLCQELVRQGDEVQVIAPWDAGYRRQKAEGMKSSQGGKQPADERRRTEDEGRKTKGEQQMEPHLALYRYALSDGLHTLGYGRSMQADLRLRRSAMLLAPVLLAVGYAKTISIAHRFHPQILHAHWLIPNGLIAAWAARTLKLPLLISIPGSDVQVAQSNPLLRHLARAALRQADWVTANSAELRESAIQTLDAPPERFSLMLYGVDPQALRPDASLRTKTREQLQLPGSIFTILAVGRMVPKKGFDVLLRALALLPAGLNWQAIFVGEGDYWAPWQALGSALGLGARVRWLGTIATNKLLGYYNAADVLAMPSLNRPVDGLNVCVLDALSCGCPVVASDVGGNPLAIRHEQNGLLTPEGDAQALAAALLRLATDSNLRQRLGTQARQDVLAEFGWPSLAARYREQFKNLIASHSASAKRETRRSELHEGSL